MANFCVLLSVSQAALCPRMTVLSTPFAPGSIRGPGLDTSLWGCTDRALTSSSPNTTRWGAAGYPQGPGCFRATGWELGVRTVPAASIALPRGAYGPQGSTCPPSESGGVREQRLARLRPFDGQLRQWMETGGGTSEARSLPRPL